VYAQVNDGSVPSFEQFKSMKNKLIKANKKPVDTPLTRQEREKEALT
jgi:hypothetical protein